MSGRLGQGVRPGRAGQARPGRAGQGNGTLPCVQLSSSLPSAQSAPPSQIQRWAGLGRVAEQRNGREGQGRGRDRAGQGEAGKGRGEVRAEQGRVAG